MTKDAYWDELGIAWCAIGTQTDVPRLQSRLRRQSFLIGAYVVGGVLLGLASGLLGAFTLWKGWSGGAWNFVTRGSALLAVSAILLIAALGLRSVLASGQARALPEMIDLAIARAKHLLAAIRLGFLANVLVAVLGVAGAAIRTYAGNPPATSPVWDLAVQAVFVVGLFLYGRRVAITLAKFRHLKDALAGDEA